MPPQPRPRLAVVVANGITGDSRVQKSAIAAARDGWDVALVGRSLGPKIEYSRMGPIQVIRVPIRDQFRRYQQVRDGHRFRRAITQVGLPDRDALARYRAAHQAWVMRQTSDLARLRGLARLSRPARKGLIHVREMVCDLRGRAWGWEQCRRPAATTPTGDWRHDWPVLVDTDIAFIPVLESLQPDVIHANDITMIGTVAQAVARIRLAGGTVTWLYDAHEYVRGIDWPRPVQASAFPALEREFIAGADAVVTVSPEIAEMLRKDYNLPQTPVVVRNTPVQETVGSTATVLDGAAGTAGGGTDDGASVRDAAALPAGIPLLVYSGWIAAERGLGTAIQALPQLPGVHLAIVAGRPSAELSLLLSRAEKLGVRGRVHVVPYVAQHRVPDYLSSADLGLICSRRTLNYEMSLPTKLAEYLHARLPVVASDVRTLREFIECHGVGEVFRADDPTSFAATVRRALSHRRELAARITEPLLKELSWEEQSTVLLQLYRQIAPRVPTVTCPDIPWTVEEPQSDHADQHVDVPARRRWRPLSTTAIKLGVGPANFAGQAAGFAHAVCDANPRVSAEVFMYRSASTFGYPADVYLDAARLRSAEVQADQVKRIIGRYTHLLADGFRPVLGYLNGDHIGADLPALTSAGVKVALLAHGSEIRHPLRHLERHECSHFNDAPEGIVEKLVAITEKNKQVAEECGLPLFVTTPDLLDDLPWARWAPLVVDVEAWGCDRPVMRRRRPVVLHAPSARWTKGTDRILPTMQELHRRGLLELRIVEKLTWSDMRDQVQDADVVIDQFTTGAYGTLSCEAMAAGRVVVAYISESVREVVGPRLPIVSATPTTLGEVLEELIDDRDRAAKIGMESAEFARTYHSGAWTARALADFLM